jgi:TonB family protein
MQKEGKVKKFLPRPQYPGGPKAINKFIHQHLKYPKDALAEKIEGVVVIKIDIDFKGKVVATKVISGLGYGCDEEAQRVCQLLLFDISDKLRRGKILFHKTLNIRFKLPVIKSVPQSKPSTPSESSSPITEVQYQITTTKKTTSATKTETKKAVYNYTISY